MKRMLCILLAAMLAGCCIPALALNAESSFYTWTVVNCDEWISLREAPSTGAKQLMKIPLGAEVIFHDGSEDGFVVVEYEGVTGYALEGHLQGFLHAVRVVNCDEWVSLRKSPDEDSECICKVPLDQMLYANFSDGDFACVSYNGGSGYIANKYLYRADNGTGTPRYANCSANMYQYATTDSDVVTKIPEGAKVMCYNTSERGVSYVNYGDKWGFVNMKNFSVAPVENDTKLLSAEIQISEKDVTIHQTVTDPEDLAHLKLMFLQAAPGTVGKCPMNATLTLEYSDGHRLEFLYPTDGCHSLVGADSAVYYLPEEGSSYFWEIFDEAWAAMLEQRA